MIDMTGMKIGNLTVIKRIDALSKHGQAQWRCRCQCGALTTVLGANLRTQQTKSCGCQRGVRHGYSKTLAYSAWCSMKTRCTNKHASSYRYYGGRGIRICDEWKADFVAFFLDMGERPAGFTLDRINPNGNYEPANCRWINKSDQSRFKRTTKLSWADVTAIHAAHSIDDDTKTIANRFGVSVSTIRQVIRKKIWAKR